MKTRQVLGKAALLKERFTSAWQLLSDTTIFLSTTPLFERYESMLRQWRRRLQQHGNSLTETSEIRNELIEFRSELRTMGYRIQLGSFDIVTEGFRNDTAVQAGYNRMVMAFSSKELHYFTGTANHRTLYDLLEKDLLRYSSEDRWQYHALWYRWRNRILVLSGADSETREDFDQLCELIKSHKSFFLHHLKKIT